MEELEQEGAGVLEIPDDAEIRPGDDKPIQEQLAFNAPLHKMVLDKLCDRLETAEDEMSNFESRWRVLERKFQAYIDMEKWEEQLKSKSDLGKKPAALPIVVPYAYATLSTIVTYLLHTFCGRRPILQTGFYKKEAAEAARIMEVLLQYNADQMNIVRHLYQFFMDCETYGVGILVPEWHEVRRTTTVWTPQVSMLGMPMGRQATREERTVYAGNKLLNCDPFMFFPDPTVPMSDVAEFGEYVFWRQFVGRHLVLGNDAYFNTTHMGSLSAQRGNRGQHGGSSARSVISGGRAHPGRDSNDRTSKRQKETVVQIDRGTVSLVPREWGLGDGDKPEMWIFTVANKTAIVHAQKFDADHGKHPVVVCEPRTVGYGFGQPSMMDFLTPVQDTLSWLINSHISNVRSALNNMFVVNPALVEMQDVLEPGEGKIIRLKKAAMGQDVRSAIMQLNVQDVTRGHVGDLEIMTRIGDALSGVNDNVRGLQQQGGRKTATEIRTIGEAASSRLAALAMVYSTGGIRPMGEMFASNVQQYLQDEVYIQVVGNQGFQQFQGLLKPHLDAAGGLAVRPEMIAGDIYFPIHDGTLPLDRVALLDVWKEIFLAVSGDPLLRQQFSVTKIFEHVADLGGAKNIDQFKVDLSMAQPQLPGADPNAPPAAVQSGNGMPVPMPGGGGL